MALSRGLAASGAAVIAFFVAAVFPAATWPLIDGDVWWHLRAGDEILASGVVPSSDTWSYTAFGVPWVSQDWLTNAAMAAIRGLGPGGDTALSLLFGLLVVTAFAVLWRTIGMRRADVSWAWRIVWLTAGLIVAAPVLGVRVQIVDLLMTSIVLWLLARYHGDRKGRWIAVLPVLAALWANLHAGWPMLFLLGGAVLVGEGLDRGLQRSSLRVDPLGWREIRNLGVALAAAFVALAINPNGFSLWAYPASAIGNSVINIYIAEWFPVTSDPRLFAIWLGFIVVAVLPTLARYRRGLRTADALTVIGLTLMPMFAVRFLLFTGPLVAVIAAAELTPVIAHGRFGRWLEPRLASLAIPHRGGRLALNMGLAVLIALVGVGASLAKVTPHSQATAEAETFPASAVEWLREHRAGDRMFNLYEWGGYLIDARPGEAVYVDGRAQDIYSDAILLEYADVFELRADPQPVFDRWGVDYVVFASASSLGAWLDNSALWESVYADPVAEIWARR